MGWTRFHRATFGVVTSGLVAVAAAANADQVYLHNGDRVTGTLSSFEHNVLLFDSAAAGSVRISRGQIAAITTDDIVTIIFADDTTLTGRLIRVSEETMSLTGPYIDGAREFAIADVRTILPGTATGIRWRGRINVGAGLRSGNTDTRNVHVDAEAIGRTENDRLTGRFELNWAEDDGDESANDALLSLKYDRFVTDRLYLYGYTSLERDRMKDLRLRTTVGPGAGYQVIDTPTANLHIEGGPTYLHANFRNAEDESSIAARWALGYEQHLPLWHSPVFFHNHELIADLQTIENFFIRSRTGIRMPLMSHLNATAQVNVDYDNDPAPGATTTDTAYLLTLGYTWH